MDVQRDMVAEVLLKKKKRVSQNRQMWKGKVPLNGGGD
jgi:hypothetical protein